MTDLEIIDNIAHYNDLVLDEPEPQPRIPPGPLRRLARLGAGVEGSAETAQAALNVHNQRQASYRQAFEAACEDAGISIPPGEFDVKIDWQTGEVSFVPRRQP